MSYKRTLDLSSLNPVRTDTFGTGLLQTNGAGVLQGVNLTDPLRDQPSEAQWTTLLQVASAGFYPVPSLPSRVRWLGPASLARLTVSGAETTVLTPPSDTETLQAVVADLAGLAGAALLGLAGGVQTRFIASILDFSELVVARGTAMEDWQPAFAAAIAASKALVLPPGDYPIRADVNFNKPYFRVLGVGARILNRGVAKVAVSADLTRYEGVEFVYDYDNVDATTPSEVCVSISANVDDTEFNDCAFTNPTASTSTSKRGSGLYINALGVRRVSVVNPRISGLNYGILVNGAAQNFRRLSVVNPNIYDVWADGIEINTPSFDLFVYPNAWHASDAELQGARFIEVVGGTISVPYGTGTTAGVGFGAAGAHHITIHGTTFQNCRLQAVHIEDRCSNVVISGIAVRNDTVSGVDYGTGDDGGAVHVLASRDVRISGVMAELNGTKKYGIFMLDQGTTNSGQNSQRWSVEDSTINGASVSAVSMVVGGSIPGRNFAVRRVTTIGGIDAMVFQGEEQFVVEDCVVLTPATSGLKFTNGTRAVLRGNRYPGSPVVATAGGDVVEESRDFIGSLSVASNVIGPVEFPVGRYAKGQLVIDFSRTGTGDRATAVFDIDYKATGAATATFTGTNVFQDTNGALNTFTITQTTAGNVGKVSVQCNYTAANGTAITYRASWRGTMMHRG